MTLHKNNIKREYTALQSLKTIRLCNHKKGKKEWGKIIPCKESDNIAAVTSIWRGVFVPIDREHVAMALNQALSKWSVTIVTLRLCKTHSFTDSVILLHWATLLSFAKQLIPLDNFETKLHNDKYTTVLFHHDVLRCPGAKWASGHQQPPCWLFNSINYGDVKWPPWRLEIPANRVFVQQFVQTDNKTAKFRVTVPLWGETTLTGCFPHKGTVTRKTFYLMTS